MGKFVSHLDQARRDAALSEERCRKAVSTTPTSLMVGGGEGLTRLNSQGRQETIDSREQLSHYRGQPFTSVRPIAQRIAGQPIRLSKITNVKGKQNRSVETRQCEVPEWVKQVATRGFGGSSGELQIVDQHAILDALHNPASSIPGWNVWMLKLFTVINLEMTGAAYWWFPRVKGKTEIWALPSHWVRPLSNQKGLFTEWVVKPDGVIEDKTVPKEEISPFWYPSPANPLRPYGPLEAGIREVMVNEFVVESQKRTFQQGPHPSVIVKVGDVKLGSSGKVVRGRLKQWQKEQLRQAFNARYRGVTHYGEPMFIDRTIESIDPFGTKASEMDFGTNAESAMARVEQMFGTSAYITGASGLGSRAEAAVADANFCALTVNPKIELLSQVLTMCVLPVFDTSGQYVLFIEPARPNDWELRQKGWDTLLQSGGATFNDYRTNVLNMPPVPWGDAVMLKTGTAIVPVDQLKDGFVNNTKLGASPAEVGPNDAQLDGGANGTPPADAGEQDAEDDEPDGGKSLHAKSVTEYDDAFYDAYAATWLKLHDSHEKSLKPAILAFWKTQGEDVVKRLEETYGNIKSANLRTKTTAGSMADAAMIPEQWNQKFIDAIKPAFMYAAVAGATHELASFGRGEALPTPTDAPETSKSTKEATFDLNFEFGVDMPPNMVRAVNAAIDTALTESYWLEIQQTTRDKLAETLQKALDDGDDMRGIVKRVQDDVFDGDIPKRRAKAIARTECTHALNAGQDAVRQELFNEGVVTGKEWFATFDQKTRPAHFGADGQRRGINENFDVGGYPAKYPGDPQLPAGQRVNCRCVSSSVTAFTKRNRGISVKLHGVLCAGCEVHG